MGARRQLPLPPVIVLACVNRMLQDCIEALRLTAARAIRSAANMLHDPLTDSQVRRLNPISLSVYSILDRCWILHRKDFSVKKWSG